MVMHAYNSGGGVQGQPQIFLGHMLCKGGQGDRKEKQNSPGKSTVNKQSKQGRSFSPSIFFIWTCFLFPEII